jgi:hypothetical protein
MIAADVRESMLGVSRQIPQYDWSCSFAASAGFCPMV